MFGRPRAGDRSCADAPGPIARRASIATADRLRLMLILRIPRSNVSPGGRPPRPLAPIVRDQLLPRDHAAARGPSVVFLGEPLHDVGMVGGQVAPLDAIGLDVVQLPPGFRAGGRDELPLSLADRAVPLV